MVDRDQDGNVKKSLVDKLRGLAQKVPGLGGYLERGQLRDQDKILRTHTAQQIGDVKKAIDSVKSALVSQGKLSLLDDLDQLTRKLDRAIDTHRFDAYGYSGALDPNAVLEDSLRKLYDCDLAILQQVEGAKKNIGDLTAATSEGAVSQALPALRDAVGQILDQVLARKDALLTIG